MNANRAVLLALAISTSTGNPIRYCMRHRRIRVHYLLLAFICVESFCLAILPRKPCQTIDGFELASDGGQDLNQA